MAVWITFLLLSTGMPSLFVSVVVKVPAPFIIHPERGDSNDRLDIPQQLQMACSRKKNCIFSVDRGGPRCEYAAVGCCYESGAKNRCGHTRNL